MADALAVECLLLEEPLWRTDYRITELRKRAKVRIAGGEGNRDTGILNVCTMAR